MDPSSFRQRLRAATDPLHRGLEATPFFAALAGSAEAAAEGGAEGGRKDAEVTVDLRSYAGHLEAMRIVYQALERLRPAAVPFPLPALDHDLASLGRRLPQPGAGGFAPVARVRAQLLAHQMRILAGRDPVALAGVAYVLEGAGLGARVLHPRAARLIGVAEGRSGGAVGGTGAGGEGREGGASWLAALAARGPTAWKAMVAALEAAGGDPEVEARITDAACDTFLQLASVARALHPLEEVPARDREGVIVRELNPHAGVHPVPPEAEILEAALRAGERSWSAWPYYEARYGERGRAFTRSDSAWLVTLAALPPDRAVEQIVWLADLLSHRGMPRMLMEEHLRILHEELTRVGDAAGGDATGVGAAGNDPDPWGILLHAADLLTERRLAVLTERESRGIARRFRARVPAEAARRLPGAGRLLAAALADEADGLPSAVEALEGWLIDPDRFPEVWRMEVQRTIRAVRKRLMAGT